MFRKLSCLFAVVVVALAVALFGDSLVPRSVLEYGSSIFAIVVIVLTSVILFAAISTLIHVTWKFFLIKTGRLAQKGNHED